MSEPREFTLQKGSFCYVVVHDKNPNPTWGEKPFTVIEKSAYDALLAKNKELEELAREMRDALIYYGARMDSGGTARKAMAKADKILGEK